MQSNICQMLSVKGLLSEDQYLIPMYQRNYAWEEPHLRQLIQDVWDKFKENKDRNYYIGTLVAHRRPNGVYETVDGQQRLTTLNIILCAIKNELNVQDLDISWFTKVNISYEYRERSSITLSTLYDHNRDDELRDYAIRRMYNNVQQSIVNMGDIKGFLEYLFEKVKITRVILPADTDLNHYFEIMNSRGEQLETHEILKALIMRSSSASPYKNWLIGQIWEACADMDRFVAMNFTKDIRETIFGKEWNTFSWEKLDEIVEKDQSTNKVQENEQFSIEDVYKSDSNISITETTRDADRFKSVIKFPGFLLHVLRVMKEEDIPLDDKRLLQTFSKYIEEKDFADKFILNLLKLRFLFDKFVIKRDFKDDTANEKLNLLTLTKQKESFSYNNTYPEAEENKRVIMIESMFHVSLPSQNYKHWLSAVLRYINQSNDGQGLGDYLEELARKYMFGRFLSDKRDEENFYYNAIFEKANIQLVNNIKFPTYTEHIDLFIFNYIDYCIWKAAWNKDKNSEFAKFEFTSRNSIEHFYPQHPLTGQPMDDDHLHDIGNLCLISSSKNSELRHYSPSAKTEHYGKSEYDSLKQALMMNIINEKKKKSSKTEEIWWENDVKDHHKYILDLIENERNQMQPKS